MDIAITKKKKSPSKRYYFLIPLLVLPLLFGIRYLWFLGQTDFSVDRDKLVFGQVKQGEFTVSVRGTGLLVPDNIQWLSAGSDAKVEKVLVKAGNRVKKGDLIIELSNPQLLQQLAEAEWDLEAKEAEAKASKVAQELALLEQKSSVLNAKLNYDSSLLRNKAQTRLIATGAVSRLDYERTVLETDQYKQRWLIGQDQLNKMQENLTAQENAQAARLNIARKTLERIQQQVDELKVIATMDSIVLEMPLEPGQRITMGSNIAKLVQQDSLIAELRVPEIQIRDVETGQKVIIDTRNNKVEGFVSRIDPAVIKGNVQVDIVFPDGLPNDARPDLSVDGEIKITEIADTMYVERPLFAQSKSQATLYRLSKDGEFAERVKVKLGYGSVNQIQVLEGLKVGDRIITSDPTRFETYEKFRIN